MQIGMVGLGRMGANMTRRLLRAGHACVVTDVDPRAAEALAGEGAGAAASLEALAAALAPPRTVWLMLPAAVVAATLEKLAPLLAPGDTVVDGGNSFHGDAAPRAARLAERGVHYLDVGTSGGVFGLERGYCLMIGGDAEAARRLEPIFEALAPGRDAAPPTPGRGARGGSAERGWLHCGPSGAGHFAKMVHNGIEYGLMAAYAEGLNLLRHAGRAPGAGAQPRYRFDLAELCELWRRGSVIGSWLLDLTAGALLEGAELERFAGTVGDSGEGRWAVEAALAAGVPTPVLSAALHQRFASRGNADYANRVLSAMRHAFGGHEEQPPGGAR